MQPVRERNGSEGLQVDTGQFDVAGDEHFACAVRVESFDPLFELQLGAPQVLQAQADLQCVIESAGTFVICRNRFHDKGNVMLCEQVGLMMAKRP